MTAAIDLLRKSMDWFLYDNGLRHERVNPFRSGVVFHIEKCHIEKCHLICTANQITSFFIKSSTGLKSFKFNMVSREILEATKSLEQSPTMLLWWLLLTLKTFLPDGYLVGQYIIFDMKS